MQWWLHELLHDELLHDELLHDELLHDELCSVALIRTCGRCSNVLRYVLGCLSMR